MAKPVAWYDSARIYMNPQDYLVAEVYNVDHPILGYEPTVWTSVVVSGDEDGFETLNTVYKKRTYEDVEES
jgi:hypothetical protein